jgi:hypothetical protein
MAVALGDLENVILSALQQPGINFGVGTYPNWGALVNASIGQGEVDAFINEGYKRVCSALWELRLTTATFVLTTTTGIASYAIPPVGNPQMMAGRIFDAFYLPFGMSSSIRFEPGEGLVSWENFMRLTGQGYLRANSSGLYPRCAAIGPQRNTFEIYPNPLESGDTITITYPAIPTPGSSQVPTLVAQSDTILLPDDAQEAIANWACFRLSYKNNASDDGKAYRSLYLEEIERLRENFRTTSLGDVQQFTDQATFPVYGGLLYGL